MQKIGSRDSTKEKLKEGKNAKDNPQSEHIYAFLFSNLLSLSPVMNVLFCKNFISICCIKFNETRALEDLFITYQVFHVS